MVNTNTYLEDKWTRLHKRGIVHSNSWHQSKPGKPLRKRMQNVFIQRQMRREKESRLGNCIKKISKECKEMLRKKIEEIEVYNHALPQPHNDSKKHRRYKPVYMFKDPTDCSFDENKMNMRQNQYMEDYFKLFEESTHYDEGKTEKRDVLTQKCHRSGEIGHHTYACPTIPTSV
ncbi:hypothetical protein Tco_0666403 [Tanacetum coccineum]